MREVRTQGTEVFMLDSAASPPALVKIGNVASVGDFGPQADDIDVTNLDSTAKEYLVGLPDNGEATLAINMDPQSEAHRLLFGLAGTDQRRYFCVAYSEGATDPTIAAGEIVPPPAANRSSSIFFAAVKSARRSVPTNDVVRVTVALRISGAIEETFYTPV